MFPISSFSLQDLIVQLGSKLVLWWQHLLPGPQLWEHAAGSVDCGISSEKVSQRQV